MIIPTRQKTYGINKAQEYIFALFYIIVIYPAKCLGTNIQFYRNLYKRTFDIYANYTKLEISYLAFRNENNFRQNFLHGYICKRCADYFVIFCNICTGTCCSYKVLWQWFCMKYNHFLLPNWDNLCFQIKIHFQMIC